VAFKSPDLKTKIKVSMFETEKQLRSIKPPLDRAIVDSDSSERGKLFSLMSDLTNQAKLFRKAARKFDLSVN